MTRIRTSYRATYAVLIVTVACYALLQSLAFPVLPTIQAGLHTSQNTVTWVITAYLLAASVFTPIIGRFGDMWGKERMLVFAIGALAVGSLLAALASSMPLMIVARLIQGVGGGVLPLSFGIIRDEFPQAKITGAIGFIAALSGAGAGLGIVLAGPIVELQDFHWLFWWPLILMSLTGIAAFLVIPRSPVRTPGKVNWLAVVLLTTWLSILIFSISEAPRWGWLSGSVIALLLSAAVIALTWVAVESRAATPLIDMRMMRRRAVWTANLVALMVGVGMYSVFAFVPEYVQAPRSTGYGFGASITVSGLVLLPNSVVMFACGFLIVPLVRRFGAKRLLSAGMVISFMTFVVLLTEKHHEWEIALAMGIQGMGIGIGFAALSTLVVAAVPPEQTGVASGMNANIRTIGGSIGAAAMSSVITASAHGGKYPHASGYSHGFTMLAVATALAALASILVPKLRGPITSTPTIARHLMPHPELGMVAGGTLVGDGPE